LSASIRPEGPSGAGGPETDYPQRALLAFSQDDEEAIRVLIASEMTPSDRCVKIFMKPGTPNFDMAEGVINKHFEKGLALSAAIASVSFMAPNFAYAQSQGDDVTCWVIAVTCDRKGNCGISEPIQEPCPNINLYDAADIWPHHIHSATLLRTTLNSIWPTRPNRRLSRRHFA